MTTYETARDRIVFELSSIHDIGVVHNRERYAADWSNYLSLFKYENSIRGWFVKEPDSLVEPFCFGEDLCTFSFVVCGILQLADAQDTETVMKNLAHDVLDKLNQADAADFGAWDVGRAQQRVFESRQFGSVLCHYTEIDFPVKILVSS